MKLDLFAFLDGASPWSTPAIEQISCPWSDCVLHYSSFWFHVLWELGRFRVLGGLKTLGGFVLPLKGRFGPLSLVSDILEVGADSHCFACIYSFDQFYLFQYFSQLLPFVFPFCLSFWLFFDPGQPLPFANVSHCGYPSGLESFVVLDVKLW